MKRTRRKDSLFTHIVESHTRPLVFYVDPWSIRSQDRGDLLAHIRDHGGHHNPDADAPDIDIILATAGYESTDELVRANSGSLRPVLGSDWVTKCIAVGRVLDHKDNWCGYRIPSDEENEEMEVERDLGNPDDRASVDPAVYNHLLPPLVVHNYEVGTISRIPTPPISPIIPARTPFQAFEHIAETPPPDSPNWDYTVPRTPSPELTDVPMKSRSSSPEIIDSPPAVTIVRRSGRLNAATAVISPRGSPSKRSPKKVKAPQVKQKPPPTLSQAKGFSLEDFHHVVDYLESYELLTSTTVDHFVTNSEIWEEYENVWQVDGEGHTAEEWQAYATSYKVRIEDELDFRKRKRLNEVDDDEDEPARQERRRRKGNRRGEKRGSSSKSVSFEVDHEMDDDSE